MNTGVQTGVEIESDLTDMEAQDWLDAVDEIAEELGYFEPLGPDHSAAFIDAGPKLIVCFETIQHIRRGNRAEEPFGWRFARKHGWSSLTILADGDTFFRHRAVYGYFDRLVDDGFFEDFDQVLFVGAHSGAYGAAAYSVAAPGAHVLAIRPWATLDPAVTGWDKRHKELRRTSFTDRYGFAPDMIDAAEKAWVIHDPDQVQDAMHAALFTRPNVTSLRTPRLGWKIDREMDAMGIFEPVIDQAMEGTLNVHSFAKLYRARQRRLPYLRATLTKLEEQNQPLRAAKWCRAILRENNRPHFGRKIEEMIGKGVITPEFMMELQEPAE
ncbi:hypothetical protein [Aestuariibius sp. HNIBRBA575]|uniref:hypothetical protein n=1 Tax=Aestuariibius sp. HNIBRBA575 TaxID=3233343 RepID=UPI0034A3BAA5